MTMCSPVGPEDISLPRHIPVPTLTVLPPSSDTESWSRSPSPRPSRSSRHGRPHRSRTRSKKHNGEEPGCTPKRQWGKTPHVVIEETTAQGAVPHRSATPPSSSAAGRVEGDERGQDAPSRDLLLPPSRSWSRSPSPSRRSRWSFRSLLSRDSDGESCSLFDPENRRSHGGEFDVLPFRSTSQQGLPQHMDTPPPLLPPSLPPRPSLSLVAKDYGWTHRLQPVTGSC
ncbi:hypothetical protein EYF80_022061 [Liparis tanakae]|uniref:Uncharacterized protein n=1 Tax=Liparis tanakae TaxID=230148 RepID=A0A4Z2HR10_9TELE|nr:hypothetical protein EYF80_022061 [Liparis tanakae]